MKSHEVEHQKNDEGLTLEQAKQELSRLRLFQRAAYDFLYVFCNYDIQQLLFWSAPQIPEQILPPLTPQQMLNYIRALEPCGEEIRRMVHAVRNAAIFEHRHTHYKLERTDLRFVLSEPTPLEEYDYKLEPTDLRPILAKGISQAKTKIDYDNASLADLLEEEKRHSNIKVRGYEAPTEITISIPDFLPEIWGHADMLHNVVLDTTRFIVGHREKAQLFFEVDYDVERVNVHIGCFAFDTHPLTLQDFQRFETASTFLLFGIESLFLYNGWQMLKTYGGKMLFTIEESPDGQTPSKSVVTISLQRVER